MEGNEQEWKGTRCLRSCVVSSRPPAIPGERQVKRRGKKKRLDAVHALVCVCRVDAAAVSVSREENTVRARRFRVSVCMHTCEYIFRT